LNPVEVTTEQRLYSNIESFFLELCDPLLQFLLNLVYAAPNSFKPMNNLRHLPDIRYRQPIPQAVFAFDRELIALVKSQPSARWLLSCCAPKKYTPLLQAGLKRIEIKTIRNKINNATQQRLGVIASTLLLLKILADFQMGFTCLRKVGSQSGVLKHATTHSRDRSIKSNPHQHAVPKEPRTLRSLFEPSIDDPIVVVFDKGLAL